MDYIQLVDLGIGLVQLIIGKLSNKAPAEVLTALQAALDAMVKHKDDAVTKENLEANRG